VADAAPVRTEARVARAGNIGYGRSRSLVQDGPPPRPPCRAVLPKIGCRPTSVKGRKSSSSSLMSAVSRLISGIVTPPLRAHFGPGSGPADPSEKDGFRWSVSATGDAKAPPRPRFAQRGHNMATIRPQMKPGRRAIGRALSQRLERRHRPATPARFDRRAVADPVRFDAKKTAERRRRRPPRRPGEAISLCGNHAVGCLRRRSRPSIVPLEDGAQAARDAPTRRLYAKSRRRRSSLASLARVSGVAPR
jgi:hypothetical protein